MGLVSGIDTSILIYLVEQHPKYFPYARALFISIETKKRKGVFSAIGMIELLTGPKRDNKYDLARAYREEIAGFPNLDIIGLNERNIEIASELRARYKIRTPDAIHLATAMAEGSDEFITNDQRLQKVKEIRVRQIEDMFKHKKK